MKNLYRNIKIGLTSAAVAGALALGTYFHPVPVTRNWGDVAARDMAAKAEVAHDIKSEIQNYSADEKLDAKELAYMIASTNPRAFTEHRTDEVKSLFLFGLLAWDSNDAPIPQHVLEDELYAWYNKLFSDGSKIPVGDLNDYHKVREALFREMYSTFGNKNNVSYEDWLKGNYNTRKLCLGSNFLAACLGRYETDNEFLQRLYPSSVDLSSSQIDKQLEDELDTVATYFSSYENQQRLKDRLDSVADTNDRFWNAVLSGPFGLSIYPILGLVRIRTKN